MAKQENLDHLNLYRYTDLVAQVVDGQDGARLQVRAMCAVFGRQVRWHECGVPVVGHKKAPAPTPMCEPVSRCEYHSPHTRIRKQVLEQRREVM